MDRWMEQCVESAKDKQRWQRRTCLPKGTARDHRDRETQKTNISATYEYLLLAAGRTTTSQPIIMKIHLAWRTRHNTRATDDVNKYAHSSPLSPIHTLRASQAKAKKHPARAPPAAWLQPAVLEAPDVHDNGEEGPHLALACADAQRAVKFKAEGRPQHEWARPSAILRSGQALSPSLVYVGSGTPAKNGTATLMRPIHGNL